MSRMRIIAGECGGRYLDYPRGARLRPTSERIRESLFSSLEPELPGAVFADLFAGTGAVGLEALSRGAKRAVLVENDARCMQAIRANVEKLGLAERAVVAPGQVEAQWARVAREWGPFDLVFADPPYAYRRWEELLEMLLEGGVGLHRDSLVILQHPRPGGPQRPALRRRSFGESELSWYRPRSRTGEELRDD